MKPILQALRGCATAVLLLASGMSIAATPFEDAVASLQAAYVRAVQPGEQADQHRELVGTVLSRVQRSYAREFDLPAFTAAAVKSLDALPAGSGEPAPAFGKAMNAALGTLDPYSRYLDARTHDQLREDSTGSFGGLGLELESSSGVARVVALMEGSPAARAGVKAGDLIVRVDDLPLVSVPLNDAIARMRGKPGTPVSLTLKRTGQDDEITVSVTRDTIRRQALRSSMEGDVLVLRLGSFSGAVTAAMQKAIEDATTHVAPRGVILDLRGNPGGLLREAVLTADTFLKGGEIVSLRGRTGITQRTWQADATELLPNVPLVVLVDRRSASASELVAAALQENGRATVIGQRSFGKGTVQSTYPLGGELKSALKLTTSIYHGPSGRTVQKNGVTPDIELLTAAPARGDESRAQAALDATEPAAAQVEQSRCAALHQAPDATISCAIAYLYAGERSLFLAKVGSPQR